MGKLSRDEKLRVENLALETISRCYIGEHGISVDYGIPIDIEFIAEKSGCISQISSVVGLKNKFNVAAALCPTREGELIVIVDQDEFDNDSVLSRFSVAHEFVMLQSELDIS